MRWTRQKKLFYVWTAYLLCILAQATLLSVSLSSMYSTETCRPQARRCAATPYRRGHKINGTDTRATKGSAKSLRAPDNADQTTE